PLLVFKTGSLSRSAKLLALKALQKIYQYTNGELTLVGYKELKTF
ncbi:24109_t:CDS:1, partial [Racocetra persica]